MQPTVGAISTNLAATTRGQVRGQDGQGLIEYAVVLMLIALGLILIVAVLGHQTSNLYSNVSNSFPK